jgi:hypothetical protein
LVITVATVLWLGLVLLAVVVVRVLLGVMGLVEQAQAALVEQV